MNLKQIDLWYVEIDLPGTLKCPSRKVKWLCHFDTQPTKEIIMAAIEDLSDRPGGEEKGGFYTRLLETLAFWDEVGDKRAQIMAAGTSIGQINIAQVSPHFEVNPQLQRGASNV